MPKYKLNKKYTSPLAIFVNINKITLHFKCGGTSKFILKIWKYVIDFRLNDHTRLF